MLTPAYIPKSGSTSPDVYLALYEFVAAFSYAGNELIPPENIFNGWQNRMALPPVSNEYAIITVGNSIRTGTTTEVLPGTGAAPEEPELYQLRTYYSVMAQVDVYSDTDAARVRAYSLETVFRSLVGVDFLKKFGVTAQWCNTVREMVEVDEARQFVKRYMLELHLSYWAGVDVDSAWLDAVKIERLEDVDAFHKP